MIADIALPIPVGKYFSYIVPDEIAPYISIWSRVRVPFRQRDAVGIVATLREGDSTGLKSVLEPLEFFPLVDDELGTLADWASSFYLTPKGLVMKYVVPQLRDIERYLIVEAIKEDCAAIDGFPFKKAVKKLGRTRLFDLYREEALGLRDDITHNKFMAAHLTGGHDIINTGEKILLIDSIDNRLERYISLINKHGEGGRNILFLLPDYYVAGAYFTQKMKAIYSDRVLWSSSGISVKQRMETYFKIRHDGGYIILGNKSSVFLPIHDLSLIMVERYDDDEYRNEESFKFNAVRTAIERARLRGIPIILGSAACCVETIYHAQQNGTAVECGERLTQSTFKDTMKTINSQTSGELLDRLGNEIIETARRGISIAVYAPRKEYGSYLRCRTCREDFVCKTCGGSLNYDREKGALYCAGCGAEFPYIDMCPNCGSSMIGFTRIGASFIHDHLSRTIPSMNAILITGDSLKKELAALTKKGSHVTQCLVGTQALSKLYGYHVGKLILVGWEELRKMSGFRSEEKAHQVIANLIDALTPDEIVYYSQKKQPVDLAPYLEIITFYESELRKRREAEFPPFARIYMIHARAKTQAGADRALAKINTAIAAHELDPFIFGTVPYNKPPFHSWKILLKGPEDILRKAFEDLYNIPGIEIETDPPNF